MREEIFASLPVVSGRHGSYLLQFGLEEFVFAILKCLQAGCVVIPAKTILLDEPIFAVCVAQLINLGTSDFS